jgi:hypothetical protein
VQYRVVVSLVLAACSSPAAKPDAGVPTALPDKLSDAGLYSDIAHKTLASRFTEFAPANVLWSDGADKHRWYSIPEGGVIDSSDMDHWKFPVGTQFFKEFALSGMRLETRLVWHVADTGDREKDYLLGAYVWNDDESEATFVKDGQDDLRGTDHDAPAADTCWKCHVGDQGHVLGLSALQAGDVSALPLSDPPPAGTTFSAPNRALGYMHANCGHCHNPGGSAWVDSRMVLRLSVGEHDAAATELYQTTVGVALQQWTGHGYTERIVAGDPDASAVAFRISQRTMNMQMPPLATEYVDPTGIDLVRAWISSL